MCEARFVAVIVFLLGGGSPLYALQHAALRYERPVPDAVMVWQPEGAAQDGEVRRKYRREYRESLDKIHLRSMRWFKRLESNGYTVDEDLAAQLVDELWYDTGLPDANEVNQFMTLLTIRSYIDGDTYSGSTPGARDVLRAGLINYYRWGGASMDHRLAETLYETLARVQGDDDPEIASVMESLAESWGFAEPTARAEHCDTTGTTSGNQEARKLLRRLRDFERTKGEDAKELAAISKRAARGFNDERVNGLVRNALLRTYGKLLGRQKHAPSAEVVKVIDQDLIRMGRLELKQRTTRLLWAKVVGLMGDRASQRLRSVVAQRCATERDRAVRSTLERSAKLLGQ